MDKAINTRMPLLLALALAGTVGFLLLLPTPRHDTAPAPTTADPKRQAPAFVIIDALVFDGQRFHENTDVLVRNGRIEAIGVDLEPGGDVQRIEASGKTLLPGLIDAHAHVFGNALEQALRFGVTTVLDMFTTPGRLTAARERRRQLGEQQVADLYSAGILATAPGGHGTEYGIDIPTIEAPEQAASFVAARMGEGSDYIKIVYNAEAGMDARFPSIDQATLRALIAGAHRRDRLAVVHIDNHRSARHALRANADGLAHIFADTPIGADLLELARDRGAFVIPTLPVLEGAAGVGEGALLDDPRIADYLDASQRETLRDSFGANRGAAYLRRAQANVAVLHRRGVPILAGSDAPNPGTAHGASLHRALVLLRQAGLSPAATLASATSVPAQVFGLNTRGRIAPGVIADLLLVTGDPRADITATRGIERIWKDGRSVSREAPGDGAKQVPAAPAAGTINDFDSGAVASR